MNACPKPDSLLLQTAGSFECYYFHDMSQTPYAVFSLCFTALEEVLQYMRSIPEGVAGLAKQTADMYLAERHMPRGLGNTGYDIFTGCCPCLAVAVTIVADMPLADAVLAKWAAAVLWASKKDIKIRFMIHHVCPLVYDPSTLQEAIAACRISWNVDYTSPELAQMCFGSWRVDEEDGKTVVHNQLETAVAMAKALVATRFPHCVEAEEVSAFLETAEAQIHDTIAQISSLGAPLNLLCSLCAHSLGDSVFAERFALNELASNLNPVKQHRSYMALALAQWSRE